MASAGHLPGDRWHHDRNVDVIPGASSPRPAQLGLKQASEDESRQSLADASKQGGAGHPSVQEYRTRWLYFANFAHKACQGRFMALFYLAHGLDEAEIGLIFGVGSAVGPVISTIVGNLADRLMVHCSFARHWCFAFCVLFRTVAFMLQRVYLLGIPRLTVMLVCQIIMAGCSDSSSVLIDAITVQCLRDRTHFGRERLYGAVSWAIVHMTMGALIGQFGMSVLYGANLVMAAASFAFLACTGVPSLPQYEAGSPSKGARGLASLTDNGALYALLWGYFRDPTVIALMVYSLTLGIGMSQVENLIFLLFRELHASYLLCGVSVVVTVVFEIPLFAASRWLLKEVGPSNLMLVAGLCYSVRVVGYTLCPGGWYILIFEPMHGITIASNSVASVEIIASVTDPALAATGQALFALVRNGFGFTAGNVLGGAMIQTYGERASYRLSAGVVFGGLLLYKGAIMYQAAAAARFYRAKDVSRRGGSCMPDEVGPADERPDEER